ncbi:MAG: 2OG-Fe(II) oxygenase [Pseudomonadota bacterium]
MAPAYPIDPETLLIGSDAAKKAAEGQAEAYQNAFPYPHGSFDNFLPAEVLDKVREELASLPDAEDSFSNAQENLKNSYMPERLPTYTKNLFYALNSRPFILFLETLTGIKGLIPDPYFMGGGIHRVANGGHLDIHADFNHHGKMNLERRLNILIYLNKNWKEEYGGSFEIWDKEMKKKEKSFVPEFNRMVCFSTSSDSWHGNPEKVNHPDGEHRMSIALYYYTATWDASRRSHSTLFKPRPGTIDTRNRQAERHRVISDILPPVLYRRLAGPLRRVGI